MGSGVHTAVYYGALGGNDSGNVDAYSTLDVVLDPVLGMRSTNGGSGRQEFVPNADVRLAAAYAASWDPLGLGGTLAAARISTPSMVTSPSNFPMVDAISLGINDPNVTMYSSNSPLLRANEGIRVEAQATGVSFPHAAEITSAIWIRQDFEAVPAGEAIWLRFTSPPSQGGNAVILNPGGLAAWTEVPRMRLVSSHGDALPPGRYAIVGINAVGRSLLNQLFVARLNLPGQSYRPGALVLKSLNARPHPMMIDGSLGVLGYFDSQLVPAIEIAAPIAPPDSILDSLDVYLRVIKVA